MKTKILSIIAAALMAFGISTEKAAANDGEVFGTLIGAATGGFIGSNIGSGDGRLAATAAGTFIGALIGNELGAAQDRTRAYETVWGPRYDRPVYKPVYKPVYAKPRPAPKRKVVVHKHRVIVKHVYVDARDHDRKRRWKKKQWKKRQWEKRRRDLARTCYEHPRRCSTAF